MALEVKVVDFISSRTSHTKQFESFEQGSDMIDLLRSLWIPSR